LIALFVGIVIGAMLGVLGCLAFRRRDTEGIGDTERQLAETIAASGRAAMESNTKQFLTQADEKFKTSVEKMEGLIAKNKEFTSELEMHRKDAYVKLHTQVNLLREGHEQLNQTTGKLASTLRDPIKRGKWGEQQLRNVLELAGMVEGQDFIEQTGAGDRPDVVLRLKSDGQSSRV
jgi:DNA recombination protein RmuC